MNSSPIQYRRLGIEDIKPDMLEHFDRRQIVTKSWRGRGEGYALEDTPRTDDWSVEDKRRIAREYFPRAIGSGGCVFGAFDEGRMIGFATVLGEPIGSEKQYLLLDLMHISRPYRGKGIGRKLFSLCAEAARGAGPPKLYISAHSAQESVAFYRAMGCVHAEEVIPALLEAEPADVHMEFVFSREARKS